jgi:hypothetical protein
VKSGLAARPRPERRSKAKAIFKFFKAKQIMLYFLLKITILWKENKEIDL